MFVCFFFWQKDFYITKLPNSRKEMNLHLQLKINMISIRTGIDQKMDHLIRRSFRRSTEQNQQNETIHKTNDNTTTHVKKQD